MKNELQELDERLMDQVLDFNREFKTEMKNQFMSPGLHNLYYRLREMVLLVNGIRSLREE